MHTSCATLSDVMVEVTVLHKQHHLVEVDTTKDTVQTICASLYLFIYLMGGF